MLARDARGSEFSKVQHNVSGKDTLSLVRSAPHPTKRLILVGSRQASAIVVEQSITSGQSLRWVASKDEGSQVARKKWRCP